MEQFKWKSVWNWKIWLVIEVIALIAILWGILGLSVVKAPELYNPSSLPKPVSKLDIWLNALVWAESGGKSDIKHLDSNKRYSYGCLQFQETTLIQEVRRYGLLPNAEDKEIMNFAYDCGFQYRLAKAMLLENKGNWTHWRTSVKRIGLPPEEI